MDTKKLKKKLPIQMNTNSDKSDDGRIDLRLGNSFLPRPGTE